MTALPRLMFAAPKSGSGKTTVTCAFLQALCHRGLSPAAFKCGPDYIDPMFHTKVMNLPSRNLDLFFTDQELTRSLLLHHGAGHAPAVLEGVMGFYDGAGSGDLASSWQLAEVTFTPVVLVLDPKGMSLSLAALVRGFLAFRPNSHIAALLLNNCTPALCAHLTPLLERETGLPVVGCLPPMPQCSFESRHLGLVTAGEIADLRHKLNQLAAALEEHTDVDRLLALADSAPPLEAAPLITLPVTDSQPVIAVAQDEAFCFHYQDNLDLLTALGAKLTYFSPLRDKELPPGASALYLGGGYPELYARQLSGNTSMLAAIRHKIADGLPTVAECGGFQYLQESLTTADGQSYPMAGVIAAQSRPTGGLRRFGYITLTAQQDNLLCAPGEQIAAHEFHHWDSTETGEAFQATKPDGRHWPCIVAQGNLFAGYPHLYFYSNRSFAARFVQAAERY